MSQVTKTRCTECGATFTAYYETSTAYGMCGSCLHDAYRSGWTPGKDDEK